MRRIGRWIPLLLAAGVAAPLLAQEAIVYPAKGQTAKQQEKDQGECQTWAKEKTGIDPLAVAEQSSEARTEVPAGGRVRGAARGALAGVAIGAVAGDAGKGAGIGAATGAVAGGARQRNRARNVQAQEDQERANARESLATYRRAYEACLEGRGYTIK